MELCCSTGLAPGHRDLAAVTRPLVPREKGPRGSGKRAGEKAGATSPLGDCLLLARWASFRRETDRRANIDGSLKANMDDSLKSETERVEGRGAAVASPC